MSLKFRSKGVASSSIAGNQREYLLSPKKRNSNTEVGANYTVNPDSSPKKLSTLSKFTLAFKLAARFVLSLAKTKTPEHDLKKDLYLACSTGNLKMCQTLIERKADVNTDLLAGQTPLMVASEKGHKNIVKFLIESGADINAVDIRRETALFKSCGKPNHAVTNMLIDEGADVNLQDCHGSTPLQMASIYPDDAPIVKKLIKRGARLDLITNYDGLSALHIASQRGNKDTVEILVDAGAKIDQVAKDGKTTPIDIACQNYNFEIVKELFNAGAKIKGGTLDKLDFKKDQEKFKLFKNNANPNKGQIYIDYLNQIKELGKDHLCSALKNDSDSDSFNSSKKLINQNPYLVDIRIDSHGKTPLMLVSEKLSEKSGSKKHFEDMFDFLIANKADLNLVDNEGETVLFKACANNNANLVNKLLKHGAMSNEGRVNIKKLLSSASPEMISLIGKYLPKSSEPGPDPRPLQAKPLYPQINHTTYP